MTLREIVVGAAAGLFGLVVGFAICPSRTGTPLDKFANYLSDFYVSHDNEVRIKHGFYSNDGPVHQCILMSDRSRHAKIIGVEYYVSEWTWKEMSDNDKPDWHPCFDGVKNGFTTFPDSVDSEYRVSSMARMYSKTVILWEHGGYPDKVVIARPEQELDDVIIRQRDADLNISTTKIARERKYQYQKRVK